MFESMQKIEKCDIEKYVTLPVYIKGYCWNRTFDGWTVALVADIESKSGIVVSSVTAKTNYLITNDKTSGSLKNKAAEKHGTKIIAEIEYINGNL